MLFNRWELVECLRSISVYWGVDRLGYRSQRLSPAELKDQLAQLRSGRDAYRYHQPGRLYRFSQLSPGEYDLRVEVAGFAPLVVRNVMIRISEVKSIAIQLTAINRVSRYAKLRHLDLT